MIDWLLLSFTPLEFFPSVLADGFSLEFEWQQVSSSLQDSSQYSVRPQQLLLLQFSSDASWSPGISTETGINSHGRVYYRPQIGYHIIIIIIIIIHIWEFFTPALADGSPLESKRQQVSSSLQDSPQYSGRPQQCCRLDSLYPSANFQVLQAL